MGVESIIKEMEASLREIKGVDAVVLGGSRAKGSFGKKSDIDIGIYYTNGSDLDLAAIDRLAAELDDERRSGIVTGLGEWGPWINGGGWLIVEGIHVDFLFRDINKVRSVIEDCRKGRITMDYQPGHPHGFVNAIYTAETFFCKILSERANLLSELKTLVSPYPEGMKRGIMDKFLWEARFSHGILAKSLAKKDIQYTAGCAYRTVACLLQVLYALNETYLMNEKGALTAMESFRAVPADFRRRVERAFSSLSPEPGDISGSVGILSELVQETEELCNGIQAG